MQYISLLYVEQVEKIATPGSIKQGSIKQGILSPEKQITHRLLFEELHRGLEIMRDKSGYYNKVKIVR